MLSYNEFWYERGIELTADKRTSLVVDPPSGASRSSRSTRRRRRSAGSTSATGSRDHYTDRSLADRCIMGFNAGPPMVSSAYNNNVQIFQVPGYVVILNEMVHNARIIPIDGRPHGDLRQWSGDSRGRWEGETLVVRDEELPAGDQPGRLVGGHLPGRAVPAHGSGYRDVRVHRRGSNNFTGPWTAMMPLRRTDGPLFEYACHEGNIGMEGIMAGARRKDTQAVTSVR